MQRWMQTLRLERPRSGRRSRKGSPGNGHRISMAATNRLASALEIKRPMNHNGRLPTLQRIRLLLRYVYYRFSVIYIYTTVSGLNLGAAAVASPRWYAASFCRLAHHISMFRRILVFVYLFSPQDARWPSSQADLTNMAILSDPTPTSGKVDCAIMHGLDVYQLPGSKPEVIKSRAPATECLHARVARMRLM